MKAVMFLLFALLPTSAMSQESAEKIKALEQRVEVLEQRLSNMERSLRYVSRVVNETPEKAKMRERAAKRMAAEKKKFNADEIAKVEAMYARASSNFFDPESGVLLDSIVAQYPRFNRAGCAQLYRAQRKEDAGKDLLLQDCIKRFGACMYGDGVQVGPFAMYLLGHHYQRVGKPEAADELFSRLRRKHPKAIDHQGNLLVENLPGKQSALKEPESDASVR